MEVVIGLFRNSRDALRYVRNHPARRLASLTPSGTCWQVSLPHKIARHFAHYRIAT